MFSVLGSLDERFYIENTFVFLYYEPDTYPNDFFFFNQTNNPFRTTTSSGVSFQPKIKDCTFDSNINSKFTGLTLSNNTVTYIDGNSAKNHWHYPIGVTQYWTDPTVNTMPGAPCTSHLETKCDELWIRYIDLNVFDWLPTKQYCTVTNCLSWIKLNIYGFIPFLLDKS